MIQQPFKKVCFVGGGTMGCYNALLAGLAGYEAVIYDVSKETLDKVSTMQQQIADEMVAAGFLVPSEVDKAFENIKTETNLELAIANAGLISESVYEDLSLKQEIFQNLEKLCGPETILTTNSSALLPSDIEKGLEKGTKFAALHSHLGAMLFDIVGGSRTDPAVIDTLKTYVSSLNGIPLILKKEYKGYIFNAMLGPVLATALALVVEDIASVEEVDAAWMRYHGAPMGPFGMMDMFGLNLIYDSWNNRNGDTPFAPLQTKVLSYLAPIVGSGQLGMRTGQGFYQYPNPSYAEERFLDSITDNKTAHHALTGALTAYATLIASHDVASPHEIDRAWMAATRLHKGPFAIIEEIGFENIHIPMASALSALPKDDVTRITTFLTNLDQEPTPNREN